MKDALIRFPAFKAVTNSLLLSHISEGMRPSVAKKVPTRELKTLFTHASAFRWFLDRKYKERFHQSMGIVEPSATCVLSGLIALIDRFIPWAGMVMSIMSAKK